MKRLSRDIQVTLLVKLILLVLLWFFCFKHAEKNTLSIQQWFLSSDSAKNVPQHLPRGSL